MKLMANDATIQETDDCASTALAAEIELVSRQIGDSFTDERGHTWMKLGPAQEHFHANKRFRRNIREWIKPDKKDQKKVQGGQIGDGLNAPLYVDVDDLQTFLEMKYDIARTDEKGMVRPVEERHADLVNALAADGYGDGAQSTTPQSPAVMNALADVFEQIREINEDARAELTEHAGKVEEIYREQLTHEREKNDQLQQEVIELRVELEAKKNEVPPKKVGKIRQFFSGAGPSLSS